MNKKYILPLLAILLISIVFLTNNKSENIETKDATDEKVVTPRSKPSSKPSIPSPKPDTTNPNPKPLVVKPTASVLTTQSLDGQIFRLTSFNGLAIPADYSYTISFMGNTLNAKFCNNLSGDFVLDSSIIKSPNVIGTKMYCSVPASLMEMENSFVSILNFGANIIRVENGIMLSGPKGSIFIFTGFVN